MTSFMDCFLFCQYKELWAVILSLPSRERTQIFMTCFYNTNCISNCFSLSAASLPSPQWRWAVLGFMKSGLSQMKFRRGLERGDHISCFVVFLCCEAWALAGGQAYVSRGPNSKDGVHCCLPDPRDEAVRKTSKVTPCAGYPSIASPGKPLPHFLHFKNLFPLPSSQTSSCVSPQQKAHGWVFFFFFKVWKLIFKLSDQWKCWNESDVLGGTFD